LLDWRILLALGVFVLAISPMLYAYYQQFDLHPEKVIRGRADRSGILFIFWEQSFERLSGEGVGKNSSDYFFFFHTFLWVFLPWTVVGIAAFWNKGKQLLRDRTNPSQGTEALTLGGILLIFIIISFAQFKLPHYLNITIPLFAVLSAAYLYQIYNQDNKKAASVLAGVQNFILGLVFLLSLIFCFVVFRLQPWYLSFVVFLTAACIAALVLRKKGRYAKIVLLGAMASIVLNAVLNLHFYPSLLEYQGGSAMAGIVSEKGIAADKIYKISERHSWALDFYNRAPAKITTLPELGKMRGIWLYASDTEMQELRKKGIDWEQEYTVDQFRITRLQARFLNPATRGEILESMHLIYLP
jgi:4-amino-4-deoxy-L-arabinose transferase-like glycosyltransferase